jgi:hypothetical protein
MTHRSDDFCSSRVGALPVATKLRELSGRYGVLFRTNLWFGFFLIGCSYVLGLPPFLGSMLPLKISVAVVLVTVIGQVVAWRADGGQGRLCFYGIFGIFAVVSAYLFISGISWLFYFSCALMPQMVRIVCFGAAVLFTLLWVILIGRNVSAALDRSELVDQLFKIGADEIQYGLKGIQKLKMFSGGRGAIWRICLGIVLLAAPAVFVFERVSMQLPASHDLLLFVVLLLFPCSQVLVGIMVKAYLLMVCSPLRLERIHGKPVVLVVD